MKKIGLFMIMLVALAFVLMPTLSFAQDPLPASPVVEMEIDGVLFIQVDRVDQSGAFVSELVRVPEGATASEYALAQPYYAEPAREVKDKGVLTVMPFGQGGVIAYRLEFQEFADLFTFRDAPRYQSAQVGGSATVPEQPGILQRSWQFAKDNPIPVGIGAFLVLDILEGDGVDVFGMIGGDDGGGGTKSGDSNSGTEGSVVVQGSSNTTINITSPNNNDSTAAPNYPPQ